jgi:Ca-activated chloride channel family protein
MTNPVTLHIDLDAGAPIATVTSAYHPITTADEGGDASHRSIRLAQSSTWANRDYELSWTLVPGLAPHASVYLEPGDGGTAHALLMLLPPALSGSETRLPREVVFIIDTSGSMEGDSIVQARAALALALARLKPEERFNVIEFNSRATALFPEAQPATQATVDRAVRWVEQLRANGGTEMAPALSLALDGREDPARLRQIVFLTDGAVGNEARLFSLIQSRLGDSRLFTVGIGSAPNSHFMSKAAQAGRGSFTYIGKTAEVGDKMGELFARLEAPVMKNIEVRWPEGSAADMAPARIPDLYLGEPLLVAAALHGTAGSVQVTGWGKGVQWQAEIPLAEARAGRGMGTLWARRKIDALIDSLGDGVAEAEVRPQVVELATAHHLVSRYTSLVAVDKTPARPADAPLGGGAVPTNLPAGWSHEAVFGELPRGATDFRWHLLLGALSLAAFAALRRFGALPSPRPEA